MNNIHPTFNHLITRSQKENHLNQKGTVLWFTGLSGSGKSTVAIAVEKELYRRGYVTKLLDGDNVRTGLNNNLGFSIEDRTENCRRIAETAKLFCEMGVITICSFVSPTNEIRKIAKSIIGQGDFKLVFVKTPIEVCEARDVKGLYKKARTGEIKDFTGVSSPFEIPSNPFLELKGDGELAQNVNLVISKIIM